MVAGAPVLLVVLDNTEGVDPNPADLKIPGAEYGVLESLGQSRWANAFFVIIDGNFCGFDTVRESPAMT